MAWITLIKAERSAADLEKLIKTQWTALPLSALTSFFFARRRRQTRFKCDWSSDVCSSDLHAIGSGIHAQRASDGSRNTDEPFHPAQIVFGAKGNRAAEVRGGIDVGKVAFEDDIGLRARSEERRVGKECRSRWSPYH